MCSQIVKEAAAKWKAVGQEDAVLTFVTNSNAPIGTQQMSQGKTRLHENEDLKPNLLCPIPLDQVFFFTTLHNCFVFFFLTIEVANNQFEKIIL